MPFYVIVTLTSLVPHAGLLVEMFFIEFVSSLPYEIYFVLQTYSLDFFLFHIPLTYLVKKSLSCFVILLLLLELTQLPVCSSRGLQCA